MPRQMRLILAAATLSAVSAVCAAQTPDQPGQTSNPVEQQPAPIQRAYPNQYGYQRPYRSGQMPQVSPVTITPGQPIAPGANEATATPIQGVWLRVGPRSSVREVAADPQKLELSVDRGLVNINVHDPAKDVLILVDLPGGQTQILKNGLYTFNAESNTARVLKGEALAFPGADKTSGEKPRKVKEDNKIVFTGTNVKPHEFAPYEARMDLLARPGEPAGHGDGIGPAYGYYGPYGGGFYGAPYWAYDYPWGYPYPYYGGGFYPFGLGIGFGYYGGFGGFRGGFHGGGGFHGRR